MTPTPYSNLQRVDHMLRAFIRILKVTEGLDEESFVANEDKCDIVERQISKVGEAAHATDRVFQTQHPEIEWRILVDYRNFIVHEYNDVNYSMIWQTVVQDAANYRDQLQRLFDSMPKPDPASGDSSATAAPAPAAK